MLQKRTRLYENVRIICLDQDGRTASLIGLSLATAVNYRGNIQRPLRPSCTRSQWRSAASVPRHFKTRRLRGRLRPCRSCRSHSRSSAGVLAWARIRAPMVYCGILCSYYSAITQPCTSANAGELNGMGQGLMYLRDYDGTDDGYVGRCWGDLAKSTSRISIATKTKPKVWSPMTTSYAISGPIHSYSGGRKMVRTRG
jgi:hypothetical protein